MKYAAQVQAPVQLPAVTRPTSEAAIFTSPSVEGYAIATAGFVVVVIGGKVVSVERGTDGGRRFPVRSDVLPDGVGPILTEFLREVDSSLGDLLDSHVATKKAAVVEDEPAGEDET